MRIRELTIKNYRAFGTPLPFQFRNHFTVIAGINGRGKTALLDGIALLASRFLPLISPARSGYRYVSPSDVHNDEHVAELSMKVNCAGTPLEYGLEYTKETRTLRPTNRITKPVRDHVRAAYGNPNRADDAAPLAVYYTTDRAGYRLPKTLPATLHPGQASAYTGALFNRMVDYHDFIARYLVWTSDTQYNRTITALNTALRTFLPDLSNIQIEQIPRPHRLITRHRSDEGEVLSEEQMVPGFSPRLTIGKGATRLALSQLSDGERSFLALVSDLVRRLALANPLIDDPLKGAGIVLIDELELHLHPQWQRTVAENLRSTFPNIQFIATTHSPFIVQTLRDDELILLDDQPVGVFENRGIEEIATKVMGIEDPRVAPRYFAMLDAAKLYFSAIENSQRLSPARRAKLKYRLKKLVSPYADNPAYQAFLEMERVRAMRE